MTRDQLAILQATRDEFYRLADVARAADNWDDQCHYYSMAMGVSAAITALSHRHIQQIATGA